MTQTPPLRSFVRRTSNLSAKTPHAGPDVVWLTADANCEHGHGLRDNPDGTDKTRVQIVVMLPNRDVHKWFQWASRRGIDPTWMRGLIAAADGGAGTWRVTERPIPSTRWLSVADRKTGETLCVPAGQGLQLSA